MMASGSEVGHAKPGSMPSELDAWAAAGGDVGDDEWEASVRELDSSLNDEIKDARMAGGSSGAGAHAKPSSSMPTDELDAWAAAGGDLDDDVWEQSMRELDSSLNDEIKDVRTQAQNYSKNQPAPSSLTAQQQPSSKLDQEAASGQ